MFINAVDAVVLVVIQITDDPSAERTAPPCSTHVQHDDVPRALDPVKDAGVFCQHDGMATMMMRSTTTI